MKYLITFKDYTTLILETSNLISTKEMESFLSSVSDKYDIMNFNKIN